jgi:non-specific serine/threonine protein kinase
MLPAAGTIAPPVVGRGNLPAPITSFVGRRRELEEIRAALDDGRLVTLSGVGGVGKTRLALAAASELTPRFPDGVWVVDLAALADPALLPHTIVDSLGISQRSARDPMTTLAEFLRRRRLLLILDNCEHLLDRAAEVVDALLRAADRLQVMTTSRQRLGVTGEIVVRIAPLEVPSGPDVPAAVSAGQYTALRLFEERAATVVPYFVIDHRNVDAVTRVCQRLEGLPLALELAAVRLRVLPINDLAARLEDRFALLVEGGRTAPARQRTLRATVDWSYELCTRAEQLLWARCAVFSGTFDLAAAEAVCSDDDVPAAAVLDTLASLVDKSILTAEQGSGSARFRMLETIREYGLERLGDDAHDFRVRHRDWYLRLISTACAEWFGPRQRSWCDRLRVEQPNLRTAIDFSIADKDEADAGLELVGRPWFLWVCLFLAEGRHWLDRALASTDGYSANRLRALTTAAYVASMQGDREAAEDLLRQGAEGHELNPDPRTSAYLLHTTGLYALFFDAPHCAQTLTDALGSYEQVGVVADLREVARIQLGLSRIFSSEVAEAAALFEECRDRCQAAGEEWLLSYALYGLGLARFAEGDLTAAADWVAQSLRIKRAFGDSLGLAMALDLIAWIRAEQGANAPAATLLGAAAHLWQTFGVELFGSSHWLAYRRRCEARTRAGLGSAFDAAVELGAGLTIDAALQYAFAPEPPPGAQGRTTATDLTRREWEVAVLVAEGYANKSIATELHVSQRTAETHVQHILTKLGFSSRAQIANWVGELRSHRHPGGRA